MIRHVAWCWTQPSSGPTRTWQPCLERHSITPPWCSRSLVTRSRRERRDPVTAKAHSSTLTDRAEGEPSPRPVTSAVTAHLHHCAPTNTNGGALDADRRRCRTAPGTPALDRTRRAARPRSAHRPPVAHTV